MHMEVLHQVSAVALETLSREYSWEAVAVLWDMFQGASMSGSVPQCAERSSDVAEALVCIAKARSFPEAGGDLRDSEQSRRLSTSETTLLFP